MKTLEDPHPIVELCRAFGVSRSGYHRWREAKPTVRAREDARLIVELKTVHAQSRQTYGRPRLHAALRQRGERTSAKRIARLMRESGLRGVRRGGYRPRTTESRHRLTSSPNLVRNAPAPSKPNQVWVSDITYIPTREGWLYVAGVLDRCSRRMLGLAHGWAFGCRAALGADPALAGAAHGVIHHSDQGVQYASNLYQQRSDPPAWSPA